MIKDIEAATYCLSLVFERCTNSDERLAFVESLVDELSKKQIGLKDAFFDGKKDISDNLFHGLLTTFSIILGDWNNFQLLQKSDRERAQRIYSKVIDEISQTIEFAKAVISKNHVTFILDNDETEDLIKKKKEKYQKLMDKLDSANTLLEACEDEEDQAQVQSDNIIVVALYLISKESGNLFSKLLDVVVNSEKNIETKNFFNPKEVISMVRCFTDALLSIKHLGAIDRISSGLSQFCSRFYEMSSIHYSGLAKELLDSILKSLQDGDCQTVFRRSAGLPSAVVAFLKAEPVGMKITNFPVVLEKLQELAITDLEGRPEVRIHAINILRVVFQDAELKKDMEHYMGQGLALAIKGFTNNDWSIRNSSLMLYSAIMKRLFPNVSNDSQVNFRSGLNVIQFFVLRAPSLLKFFFEEILEFSKKTGEHNMYPSIYPISLILSKLLPYDMKSDDKEEGVEGEDGEQKIEKEIEPDYKIDDIDQGSKKRFVTSTEINQFRGLLLACSGCKNFLGRVLVARAIVPFISFNEGASFLDSILPKTLADIKKDHNSAHGRLLISKFVINNFKQVCLSSDFTFESGVIYRNKENQQAAIQGNLLCF